MNEDVEYISDEASAATKYQMSNHLKTSELSLVKGLGAVKSSEYSQFKGLGADKSSENNQFKGLGADKASELSLIQVLEGNRVSNEKSVSEYTSIAKDRNVAKHNANTEQHEADAQSSWTNLIAPTEMQKDGVRQRQKINQ